MTNQPVRFWDDEIIDPANTKFASWARYDADGNRHVWVRSEAIVRGRKRAIVAWVRIEDSVINFPQYAVLAGKVGGKNSGGHGGRPLVNSTGSSLGIAVRCSTPPQSASCIDLNPTKGPQLQPPANFQLNYPRQSALEDPDALPGARGRGQGKRHLLRRLPREPERQDRRDRERRDCRYTNSAPAAPGASRCCNTLANPGLLIIKRGKVDLGGNIEFWGVVWNANLDNSSDPDMIETSGYGSYPRRRACGRARRRLCRLGGDNIVFYALRIREHQRGRYRRRRSEHLARGRQPEIAGPGVSLRVQWPPCPRSPLQLPPARSSGAS